AGSRLKLVMTASGAKPAPQTLLDDLAAMGAETLFLTGDIADVDTARDMAAQAEAFCGGMDLLVSNAGGVAPGRLAELDVAVWDRQFNLNVRATFVLAQALYPALKVSKGAIVAVASMSGMQAHLGQGAYSPAKAALVSLIRNMAQEWAPDGIRANAVSPGMVSTPLTAKVYADADVTAAREALVPLGRIGQPDDIAEAIVYLGSPAASYVTGQTLLIDGGISDSILGKIPGLSLV
ncbi:SDR family NAD(P)-dependent oxidoreductase, partial [Actibacterium sp.]|uniref:SDR family NAD(P)-dependent oxidoreductase n=1 Tax=Actibacterium sp. TaxID=1872125 RepID=UPI003569CA56